MPRLIGITMKQLTIVIAGLAISICVCKPNHLLAPRNECRLVSWTPSTLLNLYGEGFRAIRYRTIRRIPHDDGSRLHPRLGASEIVHRSPLL